MENELELTKKRLTELSRRAFERGIQTSSDFLSPGEQAEAARLRLSLIHISLARRVPEREAHNGEGRVRLGGPDERVAGTFELPLRAGG